MQDLACIDHAVVEGKLLTQLQLSLQHALQPGAFMFKAAHAKDDTSITGNSWKSGVPIPRTAFTLTAEGRARLDLP